MNKQAIKDIDSFIAQFPIATQKIMNKVRATIQKAAPEATETINYGIPTFQLHGNLVHFSAYEHHIGFYPGPAGIAHFQNEIANYKSAKGSVQFPLNAPIPCDLITKITLFRVEQNKSKAAFKSNKKSKTNTCPKGHAFTKTSDCPTCPICEADKKPNIGLLSLVSAPARRALESIKVSTFKQLSTFTESEIKALHGMGPATIKTLIKELKHQGLTFKK
jgi:uncharacterized protein YdhG (YjbR/CyaY superfamily)